MSSRIRHESGSHVRKQSHTSLLKRTMDENKINPNLKAKATLGSGSSTKPDATNADAKPQTPALKAKTSRPVLASLTNATPRSKPITKTHKPTKPSVFKTPSAPKTRPPQTPSMKTPGAAPKSTKKAISVYTPARAQLPSEDNEVEYTHPRPPPLEDGPPSPLREAIEGRWSYTEPDNVGLDPLDLGLERPMSPEGISRGLLETPRREGLTAEFDFDQTDDYGF